jgi:hypothetical protein
MNHVQTPGEGQTDALDQIPTLTQDMVLGQVPQAVTLALDARAAEKRALMALSDELVQNLRPEIERLAVDLVQRTLQGVWDKRARIYQDI